MKTVQTVTGEITTDKLGFALMHEHIFSSSMGVALSYPQLYQEGTEEKATKDVADAKAAGVSTIIDATPVGLGRDVKALKRVAEKTGMNIIATTGWWSVEPPHAGPIPEDRWAQAFIDDARIGCDGTDIKAGILKASMDKEGPTPWNVKMHHAVGMAQLETGMKITTHTYCPMETPRHQLRLFKEVGVDMKDVIVGHILETTDLDFIKWVYDQGVWIGVDRMPMVHFPNEYGIPVDTRLKVVKAMIDAGMADRMLFSHDVASTSTLFDWQSPETRAYTASIFPEVFTFWKTVGFPKLIEMGVDPDVLQKIAVDNPKAFFEG